MDACCQLFNDTSLVWNASRSVRMCAHWSWKSSEPAQLSELPCMQHDALLPSLIANSLQQLYCHLARHTAC